MAASQYHLKAVPIWAEQVPEDVPSILDLAERWGASVTFYPGSVPLLTFTEGYAPGAGRTAKPTDWLMDRPGEGKGCCTNDEFVASFDPVTP